MARGLFRGALVGVGILFASAPTLAQSKAVIQQLDDAWAAAFNKGDSAAVAAMYAPDAYVLPPGADMIQGRDKIAAFWSQAAQQMGEAKLTVVDVQRLGRSAAREIGTVSLKTKGNPPQEITGKYVVVWRKIDGQWMLAADIWNTNK